MKSYLLLRNNQKSGPFNYDEISKKGLQLHDLVWIEGESKEWRYPIEIQELKVYVKLHASCVVSNHSLKTINQPTITNGVFSLKPPDYNNSNNTFFFTRNFYANKEAPELTTRFSQSLESLQQKFKEYSNNKTRSAKKRAYFTNTSYLLLILAIVVAGIFLINKILKDFADSQLANEAYKKQSAKLHSLPESSVKEIADPFFQNALITEIIPAADISHQTNNEAKGRKEIEVPLVGVNYNHFTVEKKGGINNLQIVIYNNASFTVDEIIIEVDYLNKSGKTLLTKEFYTSKLKPKTFKTIVIPPSKEGSDINCSIKKIASKGFETTLQKT